MRRFRFDAASRDSVCAGADAIQVFQFSFLNRVGYEAFGVREDSFACNPAGFTLDAV
jgi:hypothetical protein